MSPIQYLQVKEAKINFMINNNLSNEFQKNIRSLLNLNNVNYKIVIKNVALSEGYNDENVIARLQPNENNYEIIFYIVAIKRWIDHKCPRIDPFYENALDEIILVFLKIALVHEFVHMKQYVEKNIFSEIVRRDKELKIPPENLWYEKEARKKADEIVGNLGGFESKILELINSNKKIDDEILLIITDMQK